MASSWVSAERHVTPMMAFQFAIIYVTSMGKDLDVLEGFQEKKSRKKSWLVQAVLKIAYC
jgi:hypothetical protein